MRKLTTNAVAMLLALVGCMGCGNRSASSVDNLIRVDVMADYPEKELILQDLMDVEYIALETTDDFITKGAVKAIGKDIMLVTNRGSDGEILVFDKNGKGLRKINRLGQSGEEYTQLTGLVLDEDNDEIFVKDNPARKIGVYDLLGNYKRSFKFTDTSYYNYIFNYDRDHLICYKSYPSEKGKRECHLIISKQDGRITHEIQIPSKGIETPVVTEGEFVITPEFYLTFPDRDKWILVNLIACHKKSSVFTYKLPCLTCFLIDNGVTFSFTAKHCHIFTYIIDILKFLLVHSQMNYKFHCRFFMNFLHLAQKLFVFANGFPPLPFCIMQFVSWQ